MQNQHTQLPWEQPDWLEQATDWIQTQLAASGWPTTGPVELMHQRPWSAVARVSTADGTVYFKALAPAYQYEVALTQALARWRPDCTVRLLGVDLERGSTLVVHLGMTGILGLFPVETAHNVHDHVCWRLDNDYELRFNDIRRFGSVQIVGPNQAKYLEQTLFKATGPEPFAADFDGRYLYDKAHKKQQPVKNFIMDGRVVAGVGNIYANESLFSAGIRPTRKAGAISKKRYSLLVDKIRDVLSTAIDCGGSTISDFLDASGTSGYFQIHFKVYGRKDQPCPICSTPIRHLKLGGRASYFCPCCQR